MNIIESVKRLKLHEIILWLVSMAIIGISQMVFHVDGYLALVASLVGVTALVFIAKGDVLGQVLTFLFSVLYAIVSYRYRYWGEIATYLGMTAPIAFFSVITWIRNPYQKGEVRVRHTTPKMWGILLSLSLVVTGIFYLILRWLKTPNLAVSTISVTTSFMAASLSMLRSSYYALFYAANDLVLIILWAFASMEDITFLPMLLCFSCFFVSDIYGFINWQKMKKSQAVNTSVIDEI